MAQRRIPESSGGGGKISRARGMGAHNQTGGGYTVIPAVGTPPTSPEWLLNNSASFIFSHWSAWTNLATTITTTNTYTFNIPSAYWVDLLAINLNANANIRSLTVNGDSGVDPLDAQGFPAPNGMMDVYGYGVQASAVVETDGGNGYMVMAPANPRTVITESGSVVYPKALSGRSVARDAPKY